MGHSSLLISLKFGIWMIYDMHLTLLSIGHYFKKSNFIRYLKTANRNLYIIKCFFFIYTPFAVAAVTAGLMCGSTGLTGIIGNKALVKPDKVKLSAILARSRKNVHQPCPWPKKKNLSNIGLKGTQIIDLPRAGTIP